MDVWTDLPPTTETPANGHLEENIIPAITEPLDELDILEEAGELPRLDVVRGVFMCSNGEEIHLSERPVSSLIYERLLMENKPKIPMVEVNILKRKALQPDPNHEGYKAQLEEWKTESEMRVMRYLFSVGTKDDPPPDFIENHLSFFPNATDLDLRYLWVASRTPDDDLRALVDVILGKSTPTTKGVEEAASSFRSDS